MLNYILNPIFIQQGNCRVANILLTVNPVAKEDQEKGEEDARRR